MSIISCEALSKNFRIVKKDPGLRGSLRSFFTPAIENKIAIRGFNLAIKPGEMVGLLGPNGAGKTTLIKMLTGIIAPSAGFARVLEHEPFQRKKDFRRRIALVMGQKSQLWWDIPAMDSLLLLKAYYEIPTLAFRSRVDELATLLDVTGLLTTHVRRLSLGERMKMELMACLLHDPEILFLDEPTIGLDVIAQHKVREFLHRYQKQHRTTVLLTSHYMADVEALCDRIVLIISGEKQFDGARLQFHRLLGKDRFVTLRFSEPQPDIAALTPFMPEWLPDRLSVELRISEEKYRATLQQLLATLPIVDVTSDQIPIERVMKTVLLSPEVLRGQDSSE
jgi:ABC-2 type transport system ATP-binding protein